MHKQSKIFDDRSYADGKKGIWKLDKESAKIQREEEKIKKILSNGGSLYSVGESVLVDSDFGLKPAIIAKVIKAGEYEVEVEGELSPITMQEKDIMSNEDLIPYSYSEGDKVLVDTEYGELPAFISKELDNFRYEVEFIDKQWGKMIAEDWQIMEMI